MLTQVADGVWVRQSEWVWTNSIVVRGEDGLILVDPGIDGSELNQLADDLDGLGIPVVAGFSTHPHWDHLLWHARFGDVPRYATPAGANAAGEARERAQAMAAESASGIPLELIALVTPLPADGRPVSGEIIEHQAHAVGHAAVLLADRGVLLAADMLSDVLILSSTLAAPIRWARTRRHSTGWVRPPGTSMSWSPATAPLPRVPRCSSATSSMVCAVPSQQKMKKR
jgi:glyoxylase-like metal-dependent hydrolase (beta-lactamase superfamily II)